MELNENNRKSFMPVEPDIYNQLNNDYDLIVSCLEYIRNEIPTILNLDNTTIEVVLSLYFNFLGQCYPVIGIRNKSDLIDPIKFDYFEIEEKVEIWIANLGIENLKQNAKNITYIDWKTLQNIKEYPNFE